MSSSSPASPGLRPPVREPRPPASIVRATRCRQVHISASARRNDGSLGSDGGIELCDRRYLQGARYRAVAADAVAATIAALRCAARDSQTPE